MILLFITLKLFSTSINGFYQVEYKNYLKSDFPWNMDLPNHILQMKISAQPTKAADIYAQLTTYSNDLSGKTAEAIFERANAKYWTPKLETIIGFREERHFIDSPLLYLVDINKAADNYWWTNHSRIVRLNFQQILKTKGSLYFSKDGIINQYGWYGSNFDYQGDLTVAQTKTQILSLFGGSFRIDLGLNFINKKMDFDKYSSTTGIVYTYDRHIKAKNQLQGAEFKMSFGKTLLITEYAKSKSQNFGATNNKENSAFITEIRDLILGPIWITANFFNYGKDFRSEPSNRFSGKYSDFGTNSTPDFSKNGYYTEFNFLVPKKLITLTYKRSQYEYLLDYVSDNPNLFKDYYVSFFTQPYKQTWQYGSILIEFVKGIRTKTYYESFQKTITTATFPSAGIEIFGENPNGIAQLQFKLKDIGLKTALGERLIIGGEIGINITDRFKIFYRNVSAISKTTKKSWGNSFLQLKYIIPWDVEIYIEFGEGWRTDNLSNDKDITDSPVATDNVVKFIFKYNF